MNSKSIFTSDHVKIITAYGVLSPLVPLQTKGDNPFFQGIHQIRKAYRTQLRNINIKSAFTHLQSLVPNLINYQWTQHLSMSTSV